ncbi:MAG: glycoside hydrolase family 20 zincin-like fold domain-containing protein [Chitinophagaceae bacterium]
MLKQRTIVILFLVTTCVAKAQQIPVLPLPQHTETGSKSFRRITTLLFNGLDKASQGRLQQHWKNFTAAYPIVDSTLSISENMQLGLLGKNRQFDQVVAQLAKPWISKIGKEGYLLIRKGKHQVLAANTETGLFYGLQTLKQLSKANYNKEIFIADWPSFDYRVMYDDISRGPISTVAYVKKQIERLAELKINYLSFYIEHVVQPDSYPDFAPANGKFTIADIKELSAYASQFHMQLIGSFQSFGHFDKILSLPKYKQMGATSTMILPTDPTAKKFLENVIGELCDAFSAPFFNVNCDETFDLGKGRSKAYADSVGKARFYADHIKFLYNVVKKHNKTMMMWGDIALQNDTILDLLPKDIVYLTWEYGNQASYDAWIKPFTQRGLSYMVCPGVLNSYRMFPDMIMAAGNIDGFTRAGKQNGAMGVYTTVWDDGGALLFSGDWYGAYKAAEKSWNTDSSTGPSFNQRYETTAYGTSNGNYVTALNKLMQLREIPVTYDLNDNTWYQKILPDSGQQLLLVNTGIEKALPLLDAAGRAILAAKPLANTDDINALALAINLYRLLLDTRIKLPAVANTYTQAIQIQHTDPAKAATALKNAATDLAELEKRYVSLKGFFRTAWLKENQLYSLDIALQPYEQKIKDLQLLTTHIHQAINRIQQQQQLLPASAIRLSLDASTRSYFQYWLLCGPLPVERSGDIPAFLYSAAKESNVPPKPGDIASYKDSSFRWTKYPSPNGGISDLATYYHTNKPVAAYAYCTITTDSAASINAYISSINGAEIFCNGKLVTTVTASQQENKIMLPLRNGNNQVLIKLPRNNDRWTFSFRLDEQLPVTNHKYKYFLNAEKKNHDPE